MVTLLLPLILAAAGAIVSLGWRAAAAALYLAASASMLALGLLGILGAPLAETVAVKLAPWMPSWPLRLSCGWLASVFLVASSLALMTSALHLYKDDGAGRLTSIALGLGIAATHLLIIARDVLSLLVAWELLSFAVAIAVAGGGDRRSGMLYLIVMHAASVPMIASIAYMMGLGAAWFDKLPPALYLPVAAALLAAYTTKAGLPPLGFWVPPVYSSTRGSTAGLLVASEIPPLLQASLILHPGSPHAVLLVALYVQSLAGVALGFIGGLWSRHVRRILGYTTVEYWGFAWLLLTLYASTGLDLVLAGLAALVVAHAAYKAGLLASAWDLASSSPSGDLLDEAPGLCRSPSPACRAAAVAASSSLPIPPLAASIGELMLIYSLAVLARSYPPLPWIYAALLAAAIIAPLTGIAYTRVSSALLGGEGEARPSIADYGVAAVLLASPVLAAAAAARITPGLLNWLTLYAVVAAGIAAASAANPPRTRTWLSGELIHSTGLRPAAVGLAAPSPRLGVESVLYRLRFPRLREVTYAPAYYWVSRRLAALSRAVMRIHNGKLHIYLALLLAYMVLLFIIALWVVLYA